MSLTIRPARFVRGWAGSRFVCPVVFALAFFPSCGPMIDDETDALLYDEPPESWLPDEIDEEGFEPDERAIWEDGRRNP